jgi:hypothetical protein
MFVVVGWLKEKRPVKAVLSCYCYVCQRKSKWAVLRETEWVTFFAARTIPFLSKDSLACARCGDEAPIKKPEARELLAGRSVQDLVRRLETLQLASKSEVQRNFLLATRAARESEAVGA